MPTAAATPRVALAIDGVGDALAANLRAHLALDEQPCAGSRATLDAVVRRAPDEARRALRAWGYYAAEAAVEVRRDGDCPRARLTVTRGERVRVSAVDLRLEGAAGDDAEFVAALGRVPLRRGRGLNHAHYEETKRVIAALALERGYLEGRFSRSRLVVDPGRLAARAELTYVSGPRYRVGEVVIVQTPRAVEETLVRRFLDYQPGEPYGAALVARFYAALSASEYFDLVEVRPLLSAPVAGTVPIEVRLTPRKRHRYAAGLGASTDEGIRGRANYLNRRLSARGHRVSAALRASLIEQSLSGEYRIPRRHPADEWLSLQGGLRREDVGTFDTLETRAGVAETVRRPWGWMETRFVNLNRQDFDIGNDSRTTSLLIPGLRWRKSVSDDPIYPRRGYALDIEVRGSADALFSDVSFLRTLVRGQAVWGLPARSRLLLRGEAGASVIGRFDDLPPSERFFAGGDNSIRGYDYQDLGPEDARGKVVGGQFLGVASVELETLLTERWGVAAFVDGGNAYGGDGSATGVAASVGLGLRFRSPLGPARVDLAHPLDDATSLRLHLRIGPDF